MTEEEEAEVEAVEGELEHHGLEPEDGTDTEVNGQDWRHQDGVEIVIVTGRLVYLVSGFVASSDERFGSGDYHSDAQQLLYDYDSNFKV